MPYPPVIRAWETPEYLAQRQAAREAKPIPQRPPIVRRFTRPRKDRGPNLNSKMTWQGLYATLLEEGPMRTCDLALWYKVTLTHVCKTLRERPAKFRRVRRGVWEAVREEVKA